MDSILWKTTFSIIPSASRRIIAAIGYTTVLVLDFSISEEFSLGASGDPGRCYETTSDRTQTTSSAGHTRDTSTRTCISSLRKDWECRT